MYVYENGNLVEKGKKYLWGIKGNIVKYCSFNKGERIYMYIYVKTKLTFVYPLHIILLISISYSQTSTAYVQSLHGWGDVLYLLLKDCCFQLFIS